MHILIADNDAGTRRELRSMLQQLGHTVTTAVDGRDIVTQVRQSSFDLAIMATELPFGDSRKIARDIAREQLLPIVLVLDDTTTSQLDDFTEIPVYGYIFPPLRLSMLQTAIRVASERFSEKQSLAARVSELEEALETRKLIDRAKGKLMRMGMSEQKAFITIQARARRTQKTMRAVARTILGD